MKKNVKLLTILIIIILFILSLYIINHIKNKPEYSREDISLMIDPQITDNMYLKIERIMKREGNSTSIIQLYLKDNRVHKIENYTSEGSKANMESLFNYENKTEQSIDHENKTFSTYPAVEKDNPLLLKLNSDKEIVKSSDDTYKYYGKENLNGNECIKFSLTTSKDDELIYYVDTVTKSIIKIESYNNNEKVYEENITISYNIVTEEDVAEFDINNYADYTVNNFTN